MVYCFLFDRKSVKGTHDSVTQVAHAARDLYSLPGPDHHAGGSLLEVRLKEEGWLTLFNKGTSRQACNINYKNKLYIKSLFNVSIYYEL